MEIIQKVIHKLQKLYYTSSSDRLLAYYRKGGGEDRKWYNIP